MDSNQGCQPTQQKISENLLRDLGLELEEYYNLRDRIIRSSLNLLNENEPQDKLCTEKKQEQKFFVAQLNDKIELFRRINSDVRKAVNNLEKVI